MSVVSNASPIMNLAAVEQATLLVQLYGAIFVPDAVFQELTGIGSARPHLGIVTSQCNGGRKLTAAHLGSI